MTEVATLQKALITIKKLKKMLREQPPKKIEPIAIIGLSCRFPQAENKDKFWQLLLEGKNVISHYPEARWQLLSDTEEPYLRDPQHAYWGGYLENIADFDAYFFGITPREAMRMDPQQRLLLEVAYEAMEDAGLTLNKLAGSKTGVFTSLYASQFGHLQKLETDLDALYIPTGNAVSMAANRLSYLFDLHGPSITLDSACSSSLAALHLASLYLQNNLCELSIVGGVNINLLPSLNLLLAKAKMLSPNGQCRTFDEKADGYVQGEGVGVLILKPLSQALKDQDRIYSVIVSGGINQDGKTNGLTAPNGLQQEALLTQVYQSANIQPNQVSYLECHGTGTLLGDPIELQALGKVMSVNRDKQQPCWIGSVKTNIGHLEPAAGIASLIKVALGLHHGVIPAHLNFSHANPHLNFENYQFAIPTTQEAWPQYGEYRVAGVSGFGFGGTNTHFVLRDLLPTEKNNFAYSESKNELWVLSAKTQYSLDILIRQWCDFLEKNSKLNLQQLCYNSKIRRNHYSYRIAIIAESINDLKNLLSLIRDKGSCPKEKIFTQSNVVSTSADFDLNDLYSLANAYVGQKNIDWTALTNEQSFPYCNLPLYAWDHKPYWPDMKKVNLLNHDHPFQGKLIHSPLSTIQFAFVFNTQSLPEIRDTYHILHAGYYLEMLAFAVDKLFQTNQFTIENMLFSSPIIVPDNKEISVQLILNQEKDHLHFQFYSKGENQDWIIGTEGRLITSISTFSNLSIEALKQHYQMQGTEADFYQRVQAMRMPSEGSIHWVDQYWLQDKRILCHFIKPNSPTSEKNLKLQQHFGVMDACIQGLFLTLPAELMTPYVAAKIGKLTYFGSQFESELFLHANLHSVKDDSKEYDGDWTLTDINGKPLMVCEELVMSQLSDKVLIQDITKKRDLEKISLINLPKSEAKTVVMTFLITQLATLFSMPKEDVNVELSLKEIGIDSLMSLVLIQAIESAFGYTFAMSDILEGSTLIDLANRIIQSTNDTFEENQPQTNPWLAYRKPQNHPKARLFCFPYGGAGASIYRHWQETLSPDIEVCAVQLPGREERMNEQPLGDIHLLVDQLIENLHIYFDKPFAFFGHSFGSLINFKLAQALQERNLALPIHLFVSAYPEPNLPTVSLDHLIEQLKNAGIDLFSLDSVNAIDALSNNKLTVLLDTFNENGVIEYNEAAMNKKVLKVLLPIFINDMRIVKSYHHQATMPLPIPISVFIGRQDTFISAQDMLGWPAHTAAKCNLYEFDSGHLFIKDDNVRSLILKIIDKNIHHSLIESSEIGVTALPQ